MTVGGVSGPPTLVIQTAHLGDVVLTLPLLMAVAEREGQVDVVTTPQAAPLVSSHRAVRRVIPFDKRRGDRGLRGLNRLATELRTSGYRQALLAQGSLRSGALAYLARIPSRVGFAGDAGSLLCTTRVRRPPAGPMAARLLTLAGARELPRAPWIHPERAERTRVAAWLEARGLTAPFVVLAPGARWGTKRWPGFVGLASRIAERVVVVGGPEDREAGNAVSAAAPGRAFNAAGEFGLVESAALIERSAVVVTNDSLPLHLATAMGRPVVAIFGPTAPAFGFAPIGDGDRVVEHPGLWCRPCSVHGPPACPLGHHRCMRELSVDRVLDAVRQRLGSGPAPGGA